MPLYPPVAATPNAPAVGETLLDRYLGGHDNLTAATSGQMLLTFYTARKSETVGRVRVYSGNTGAAATPTLVRLGVYLVAADDALTLVASTANDTALLAGNDTVYTKDLSATFAKVAGRRYAVGLLVVSATTMPQLRGWAAANSATTAWEVLPRLTGRVDSQADLPASVAAGSFLTSTRAVQFALLPPA
jgi:hypothetical protein